MSTERKNWADEDDEDVEVWLKENIFSFFFMID